MMFHSRFRLIVLWVLCAFLVDSCQLPNPEKYGVHSSEVPIENGGHYQSIKVLVERPGIYQLSGDTLLKAGLATLVEDPTRIEMKERGESIPFWMHGKGTDLVVTFYGEASSSIYSKYRIYWLGDKSLFERSFYALWQKHPTGDERAVKTRVEPVPESLGKNTILATMSVEQNSIYMPQVESGDHWFWVNLPAPGARDLEFALDNIASGPARLRLVVWAATEASAKPDHHLKIAVNGVIIIDHSFDGKGRFTLDAQFDTDVLKEGTNSLTIEAPGDTGARADLTFIDRFEIDYARDAVVNDEQPFFFTDGSPIHFSGSNNRLSIYDITDAPNVTQVGTELDPESQFIGHSGRRYIASSAQGGLQPAGFEAVALSPDILANTDPAIYIAVAPSELIDTLQPLLEYRKQTGIYSMVFPVESVYDQFNYGYPEPIAIQRLIQYAFENWPQKPRYLLIVGDASYDPRGYISPAEANRIPTELIQTVYGGETASDILFAQLNDDPWPDIAVGRIPARTSEQLQTIIQKTLQYEQQEVGHSGKPGVAAIADGQELSFKVEAQSFLDGFANGYDTQLFAPDAGITDANKQIAELLGRGDLIVGYFGHGSVNMWGKDQLFTTKDIAKLNNENITPLIVNMTCLTGLFIHPTVESMAEAFLWQPQGGAVAILAPSSLTLPGDQNYLIQAFVDAFNANPDSSLGELHLLARRKIPAEQPGALDVMRTFMLFGDPALRLIK